MLPEALGLNFARRFSSRMDAFFPHCGSKKLISISGCTSIILLDLKELECTEAVNELTAFAVGEGGSESTFFFFFFFFLKKSILVIS